MTTWQPLGNHLVKLQIVIAILWWVHITQAIKYPSAHWIECEDSKQPSGPLWTSIRMLGNSFQAFNRELKRDTWSDWTSRPSGSRLWYVENMTYTAVKQLLLWNQLFLFCSSGEKSNESKGSECSFLIRTLLAQFRQIFPTEAVNMILDFDTLMFIVILKALAGFR